MTQRQEANTIVENAAIVSDTGETGKIAARASQEASRGTRRPPAPDSA